jgi:hypothetical protein
MVEGKSRDSLIHAKVAKKLSKRQEQSAIGE